MSLVVYASETNEEEINSEGASVQLGIGYTVTTDCLVVHRIVRLNLNWKRIVVQSLQFKNLT